MIYRQGVENTKKTAENEEKNGEKERKLKKEINLKKMSPKYQKAQRCIQHKQATLDACLLTTSL